MFVINEDKSIYVTRGDAVVFSVVAEEDGVNHVFKNGDVVRFKVFEKKACENVVLQKDTLVEADMESVEITLDKSDTKIGDVISKPTDYWYEVELNPFTNPQTIIGYDDDGAKVFRLYPEGADSYSIEEPDDLPLVDDELDPTSNRPIQNQAVARALVNAVDLIRAEYSDVNLSGYLKKKDVDFDVYVKKTDYATNTEAGLVKVGGDSAGVKLTADKMLVVASAGVSEIQKMESANRPITPYYLKYAIKTGLSKNDLEWTEEEKAKAREVIGAASLETEDKLNKHAMAIYNDSNANLLGITSTTTLNQLIEGGLVPNNSIVKLWVNDDTGYGKEVRTALNSLFGKNIYGYLTIERINETRRLSIQTYDTLEIFSTNYTEINGTGWYGKWECTGGNLDNKIQGSSGHTFSTVDELVVAIAKAPHMVLVGRFGLGEFVRPSSSGYWYRCVAMLQNAPNGSYGVSGQIIAMAGNELWFGNIEGTSNCTITWHYVAKGVTDYIVAEGASGGWYYRKWASGRAECYRNYLLTPSWTTVGDMHYCYAPSIALPFTFVEMTSFSASIMDADYLSFASADSSGNNLTSVSALVMQMHNSATNKVLLSLQCHGRWK